MARFFKKVARNLEFIYLHNLSFHKSVKFMTEKQHLGFDARCKKGRDKKFVLLFPHLPVYLSFSTSKFLSLSLSVCVFVFTCHYYSPVVDVIKLFCRKST